MNEKEKNEVAHTAKVCSTTAAEAKEGASRRAKAHARDNRTSFMLLCTDLMLVFY